MVFVGEMEQPTLFDVLAPTVTNCAAGHHATLRDEPPRFIGACVNIDHVCPLCEQRVRVTSWTINAWNAAQTKKAKRKSKS